MLTSGYSRAADKTFFTIPELHMGLDAGEVHGRQPKYVFVTHTHIDHSCDLWYISQKDGTTIYCPASSQNVIRKYIKAELGLNLNIDFDAPEHAATYRDKHWELVPCKAGDTGKFGKNGMYTWEAFNCHHVVDCIGYCFSQATSKLKDEHVGKSGKEIGLLKKQGIEVTEAQQKPLFVYVGDTSIEVFTENPQLFNYPTIIIECTFLDLGEGIEERCARDGHIAWSHLEPYVVAHPTILFVLIHFSLRYKRQEVLDFFNNVESTLGQKLSNVVLFFGHGNFGLY